MKTKDLLKTKLSSLAGPPLRQPRPLDERLRPARRQPDDHDDRDGRQSGIRLRRPQATVETFTQLPDYTVTFTADGTTVKTMTVEDGYTLKDSDYPAVPTKTGYTGEWVKYTSAIHSNVTVQAKYTAVVTKYTVTFKADNTVVKTMTVKDGYTLKASDYPTVPAKSGYTGEWVKYTAAIHSDITINAVYEPSTVIKQYTVVFRADAKVLKTMKVEVGYTLQDSDYPEIPAKEGYTGHWDKSTTRIIKNTIINVIYSDNSSHVVTFIFDGAQIGTLTVTDGYVLKNSDYPSPFAPVGYIVTWEKYTLPIHSDITVTGKLQSDVTIPPQPTSPGEIMSGGEGEPVENLSGYLLPYDSPYLKANIEYLGNLYWDNNTEEYWLAMTKCSLLSLFLSSKIPAAGILGAAATFLDVFNHFFGEDTPSDAWHDFYKVSIDVYIETSDFVGISHREYIYVWANNSPTSAFWYQVPTANCTGGNS